MRAIAATGVSPVGLGIGFFLSVSLPLVSLGEPVKVSEGRGRLCIVFRQYQLVDLDGLPLSLRSISYAKILPLNTYYLLISSAEDRSKP